MVMSYHKKLKETLPLLTSFGLLVVIGVALLSFSKAGAALVTDTIESPPTEDASTTVPDAEPVEETTSEATTTTEAAETTEPEVVNDAELISAPLDQSAKDALKHVYVESNEPDVYNHAYFAANQIVDARGTFNNDVFVAGDTVTITGKVDGNVFAAGNTVTIDASVTGSVWVAGNTVVINDAVEQNVTAFGANVTITESGFVGKDLTFGAANATIEGFVMGQVTGDGENITVTGHIHQHLMLDDVGKLTIDDAAWVGGNLTYTAKTETIVPNTVVGGATVFTKSVAEETTERRPADKDDAGFFSTGWFLIKLVIGLIGYLLLGAVLLKLFPKKLPSVVQAMYAKPGPSLGWGALYLLVAPAAVVTAALTLIGLPLAGVGALVFFLSLFVGKITVGFALGKKLLKNSASPFAQFALGFSFVYIVFKVLSQGGAILSALVSITAFGLGAWAIGAILLQCKHKHE